MLYTGNQDGMLLVACSGKGTWNPLDPCLWKDCHAAVVKGSAQSNLVIGKHFTRYLAGQEPGEYRSDQAELKDPPRYSQD